MSIFKRKFLFVQWMCIYNGQRKTNNNKKKKVDVFN